MPYSPTTKAILFVSGGLETVPAILRAKELSLCVVVSDRDANAPGMALADYSLAADTYNVEDTVREAQRFHETVRPLNGVICVAADVPKTVAGVAETLNLPGITSYSAALAADKLAMKDKFSADQVPIPWYEFVESPAHLKEIFREKQFPLIVKPVDSRGARGVLRITQAVDLESVYAQSLQHSPSGRVMVEHFLSGPQVSTESMVFGGIAYTPGFSDRNYEYMEKYAPHVIENGGDLPSCLEQAVQEDIKKLVQEAARSLGVENGVVKGDIVVHEGKPFVIEMAARLSGGYFCTHEIPLNTGVDFVGCAIRQAIGEKIYPAELQPKYQHFVCQRYLFPQPGVVQSIEGVESVRDRDHIKMCEVRVKPGDTVSPAHSHPARAGVVIATGLSRQNAMDNAEQAVRDIVIRTR